MPSWTDKTGRTLIVAPPSGSSPGRLAVGREGESLADYAVAWLDDGIDPAEVAVAIFAACGQPAPVILPRPEIDPAVSAEMGSLGVWLAEGCEEVVVAFGSAAVPLGVAAALDWAALVAAYAEAAISRQQEPDPRDVERMAGLVADVSRMAPEDAARYLLRQGVTLPKEGGGRG